MTSELSIASGGEFYEQLSMLKRAEDDNVFLSSITGYRISLGKENRSFAIYGCVYPVAVDVKEFHTKGQFNNKIVRPIAANVWQTWDVDDNRFEGEPLTYIYQAGGFYYFEKDAIENNLLVGRDLYRISFLGGAWQFMHYNERPNGSFKTYYSNVDAQ